MMRRLAVVLAVVAGVVVVGVLVAVFNLNRLIAEAHDDIVAGVSAGFGRPVRIDRMRGGFHDGVAIVVDGLHVAEDPAFGAGDFVAADRTHVVVRLWPLLQGRIEIRRVVVGAPRLTIVRTAKGISIDSLGRRGRTVARAQGAATSTAAARTPPAPSPEPAEADPPSRDATAVVVALLEIEDGVVRYVDGRKEPPVETVIEPLDIRVSDLSLTDAMRVEIDAESVGATPTTVRVRGTVGPVGDPPFATDVPIEQHVAVHGPALDVADLALTGRVRRDETGTAIAGLRISAPTLRAGGVDLAAVDLIASERDGVATLERMAFGVFGGSVQGNGRVDHSGATPAFAAEMHVRGVDVSQALAARESDLAARFEGHLDADCSVSGNAGDDAVVRRTLKAMGHAAIRNGRLLGVNVADGVLSGVTGVAGLVSLVPARVRGRYPEIFANDDTRFDELSADVSIADERIRLDSLVVSAPDYAVRGTGTITFTQRVDVKATLVASAPLTADVVGALKESNVLTDADGRLAIPFRLTGVLPKVRPQPDPEYVARVLRKALAGETLERLIEGSRSDRGHGGKNRKDANDAIRRELDRLLR
jgi:uncharacterized protein involved in outer membrane biogenesis